MHCLDVNLGEGILGTYIPIAIIKNSNHPSTKSIDTKKPAMESGLLYRLITVIARDQREHALTITSRDSNQNMHKQQNRHEAGSTVLLAGEQGFEP